MLPQALCRVDVFGGARVCFLVWCCLLVCAVCLFVCLFGVVCWFVSFCLSAL